MIIGQYSVKTMGDKVPQLYNCREKYIVDCNGKKELLQVLICKKPVFNPEQLELYNKWDNSARSEEKKVEEHAEYLRGYDEAAPEEIKGYLHSIARENDEKRERAQRRAKAKVFDYIIANPDLDVFCTFTLDREKIDRKQYDEVIKKFNSWADNRVRRDGLKYVAVPELHKDGAIHFHLLTNRAFPLLASGTYLPPVDSGDRRKPLKADTLRRKGYSIEDCQEVYNVPSWKLGFSTAMITQGDRQRVARYISKYITKTLDKVGGRYYLHGGDLAKPIFEYSCVDWDGFVDEDTFTFSVPGNEYAII